MSQLTYPTEYIIEKMDIEVEGESISVVPLFVSVDIFENIYLGGITGSVTIMDTDGGKFLEETKIEFIEPFSFAFKSASDERIEFEGVLSGLRNETTSMSTKTFVIDFSSNGVRNNEMKFVTKKWDEVSPEEVAEEMAKELDTEIDVKGQGEPLSFVSSRMKPLQVMRYVLNHGVTTNSSVTTTEDKREEKSKGSTGFLFWETLDGYRFCPADDLLEGNTYEEYDGYKLNKANKSLPMEEAMKGIIDYKFPQMGDFQSKLRSGAYKSCLISFDIDTGIYKEVTYEADEKVTTKNQLDLVKEPTRYFSKLYHNERFQKDCEKAKDNSHDQSRRYLQQGAARQNALADQHGRLTLPPQFLMRAGDTIKIEIGKYASETETERPHKKHSGRYLVKQVSHHIGFDQKAYTQVSTIRAADQQDEASAEQ